MTIRNEKQLRDLIKEELNNISEVSKTDIIDMINLDDLSKYIKKEYGIIAKFNIIDESDKWIMISSNNLINQTGMVGQSLFTEIVINIGVNVYERNIINDFNDGNFSQTYYFFIKFNYKHPKGGSNGLSLGSGYVGYNFKMNKWSNG